MEADIKGYVVGSGADVRAPQDISIAADAAGLLNYSVLTPGVIPSLNTPFDLTAGTLTFVIADSFGNTLLSFPVTITAPPSAGSASLTLAPGSITALAPTGFVPKTYQHTTLLTQGALTNYRIYPWSRFVVSTEEGQTTPAPGPGGPPGPPGTPPLYSAQTADGATGVVLCSYAMVAGGPPLDINLRALGRIVSPAPGDSGLGECSIRAYFVVDAIGNITPVDQDAQGGGGLSASYRALAQQPALSTRAVSGSAPRVDVLITGAPNTTINYIALDTLTTPAPVGSGAGNVGPAGAAGPSGPPGYAPTYTSTATDGTTFVAFASYSMAPSSRLSIKLRPTVFVSPDPGDGGMAEYTIDSVFSCNAGGNITRVPNAENIDNSGGAMSASFAALSQRPAFSTAIVGSNVIVYFVGCPSTTATAVATDTLTIPAPPGAQGPIGPVGPVGPIGPAGVPSDYKVSTIDATPTTLATYPIAADGLRYIEARILGQKSDGAVALVEVRAFFNANGAGVPSLLSQRQRVYPQSATWPQAAYGQAVIISGSIALQVVGAVGSTIAWEFVDWTTVPPLSSPSPQWPAPPGYTSSPINGHADAEYSAGAFKWRQHEQATATFDGSTDTISVTWPDFQTRAFKIRAGAAKVTGALGPIAVEITSITSTGCTVRASDAFTGSVDLDIVEVVS